MSGYLKKELRAWEILWNCMNLEKVNLKLFEVIFSVEKYFWDWQL